MSLLAKVAALFRRRVPPPATPAVPELGVVHWVPPTMRVPICGLSMGALDRWTSAGALAGCPKCRVEWSKIGIRKFLNDR